jgi:hypothetical protein
MAVFGGDFAAGRDRCGCASRAAAEIKDAELRRAIEIWIPATLGRVEHGLGNLDAADEHFRNAYQHMLEFEHPRGAARVLGSWATLAVDRGELGPALDRAIRSLLLFFGSGDDVFAALSLRMVASILAMRGAYTEAARFMGAVQEFERRQGPLRSLTDMDARVEGQALIGMQEALRPEIYEAAKAAGSELTFAQAVDEALVSNHGDMEEMPRVWESLRREGSRFGPGITH